MDFMLSDVTFIIACRVTKKKGKVGLKIINLANKMLITEPVKYLLYAKYIFLEKSKINIINPAFA